MLYKFAWFPQVLNKKHSSLKSTSIWLRLWVISCEFIQHLNISCSSNNNHNSSCNNNRNNSCSNLTNFSLEFVCVMSDFKKKDDREKKAAPTQPFLSVFSALKSWRKQDRILTEKPKVRFSRNSALKLPTQWKFREPKFLLYLNINQSFLTSQYTIGLTNIWSILEEPGWVY